MKQTKPEHPETIRGRLLAAYDAGKRDLPWRDETDPYRIWVSEIMLQQTRVETVIPYYEKWLHRFPDLESLAAAEEDEVLRLWQGLGYYSRARRLLEGALVVRERFGGTLPETSHGLREIPGIGEYTAGAVASIAFGEVVPAVDGNVKRVLSRLFDLEAPRPSEYRALAEALVDPQRPGDFNQALMELGALICVPRNPRCSACPLAAECLALARGTVADRPARKRKTPIPEVDIAVGVMVSAGGERGDEVRLLVQKRPEAGLLAGMWEFPGVVVAPEDDPAFDDLEVLLRAAADQLASRFGFTFRGPVVRLQTVTHVFSHLKARYHPFLFILTGRAAGGPRSTAGERDPSPVESTDPHWRSLSETVDLPLPVAQRKILEKAREHLGV